MNRLFKTVRYSAVAILIGLATISCHKDRGSGEESVDPQLKYLNTFACNALGTYYLWSDEVISQLESWMSNDDPVKKVKAIRYKDSSGREVDKWTMLTDDFGKFTSTIDGITTTYGCDICLYYNNERTKIYAVVRFVSADSPAEKAGLKRGDVIWKINGSEIDLTDYASQIRNDFFNSSSCKLTMGDGKEIQMSAVNMYEDPVLMSKVFDCGGKKVGYLAYMAFTLESFDKLVDVCEDFSNQGVSELILDMRYNTGGYVIPEYGLAAMLAPAEEVKAKAIFERAVYNSRLTEHFDEEQQLVRFSETFNYSLDGQSCTKSTRGVNVGPSKIYAILTGESASASESILTGLGPYVDIEIIGRQSVGKFCTGIAYSGPQWYKDYKDNFTDEEYEEALGYTDNWGLYLMISRYADKNGNTPCMPDGFVPDIEIDDTPIDGIQLGDSRETMLATALARAGWVEPADRAEASRVAAAAGGHMVALGESLSQRGAASVVPGGCRILLPGKQVWHDNRKFNNPND